MVVRITDLIVNHIKTIKRFSDLGALLLKLDMDQYKVGLGKLRSAVTDLAMEETYKLAVVMLVPPDTLQQYLNETLTNVDTRSLSQYKHK